MLKRRSKKFSGEEGFTLIELITVLVIIGILGAVVVSVVVLQADTIRRVYNNTQARSELRHALRTLRSDIQKISPDSLISSGPAQLSYIDIDGNRIDYAVSGNRLTRNESTVLNHLSNASVFNFLDRFQNEVSTGDTLCYVQLNLQINLNGETETIQEVLHVRN